MSTDILDKLKYLQEQATKERSHYYVKATVSEAILEIVALRASRDELARMVGIR